MDIPIAQARKVVWTGVERKRRILKQKASEIPALLF
jgi:hypothetical protein